MIIITEGKAIKLNILVAEVHNLHKLIYFETNFYKVKKETLFIFKQYITQYLTRTDGAMLPLRKHSFLLLEFQRLVVFEDDRGISRCKTQ